MSPNPINLFALVDVTKPSKLIRFGAMDVTRPYKYIRFGAMDVTKPHKLIYALVDVATRTGIHRTGVYTETGASREWPDPRVVSTLSTPFSTKTTDVIRLSRIVFSSACARGSHLGVRSSPNRDQSAARE